MDNYIDSKLRFDDLALVKFLKKKKSIFLPIVKDILQIVTPILDSRIPVIFPDYTLHNTEHSFRIIGYMSKIIDDYRKLSDLEIALLICSALLHDIGMGISNEDLEDIKNDTFKFSTIKYSAMLRLLNNDHKLATQEYIRRIHAELSGRFIKNQAKGKLSIPNLPHLDMADELAKICESHTKNYDWIKANLSYHEIRGDYSFNPQFIACILRLGDILDIDANRTPYRLYKIIAPTGISAVEWKQHFDVFNNEKINLNQKTQLREIHFYGKSKNADVHRKLLTYIGWVEAEFAGALALVSSMKNEYNLPFDSKPTTSIKTEGFTFSGYKMTLKFEAISSLLMGEKIYGNKQLGLRELIQNSLDACRIRQENEKTMLGDEPYVPTVRVILSKERGRVIIKDNGLGMSLEVIKNHFLNIGVSYYKSFDFLLQDLSYKPIGNYGIGFLSCFMLSDQVTVQTRHFKSKKSHSIQLEKGDEWTSLTEKDEVSFFGTEVSLDYEQFMAVFEFKLDKIKEFLNRFFLTDGISFKLLQDSESAIDIKNELFTNSELDKTFVKIDLSDYLSEIEGYIIIRKKTDFIRTAADLTLDDSVYLYNPLEEQGEDESYSEFRKREENWEWLVNAEDLSTVTIDNYVSGTEIKYYSVPLINRSMREEFESGMNFTERDTQSVVEKLSSKLNWISILLPKDFQEYEYDDEVEPDRPIIKGVNHSDLVLLGHEKDLPTYKFVNSIRLFEGTKNHLYLPFEVPEKRHFYFLSRSSTRQELFIRNVLIKDFHFTLPISASIFDVSTMVININSRKFVPDISRNNIDSPSENELNYLIGKVIHLGAIKNLGLGSEEQRVLNDFVETFYDRKSEFEKY